MANRSLLHQMEARERRGRWFPALAGLLSISLLASTWVGLFVFLGANAAYGTLDKIRAEYVPNVDEFTLSLPNLSVISRIYARDGELLGELHDGRNSEPVPIDQVPENVKWAVLAAEDRTFYEHEGVSFPSIARAALDTFRSGNTIGGSTITQQIVKSVFVGNEVTLERKIKEAFIAAELEREFEKDQLLEFYINSVYFGSGAYGIKAAAREFYGKTMDELTIDEAATLAVLVRNPGFYDPRRQPSRVLDRRNDVIDLMLEDERITESQATTAKSRPLGVIEHRVFRGPAEHVRAEAIRQLLRDPEFAFLGDTYEERKIAVFGCPSDDTNCEGGGGLNIETAIDLTLQLEANELLLSWLPTYAYAENLELCKRIYPTTPPEQLVTLAENASCAPTGAISMVDNYTGEVLVMASGLPFETQQFDLAVQGRRNPGSAFKVFGLVAALENGITLGNTFSGASPLRIECPTVCSSDGNVWNVSNAGSSYGRISLDAATSASVNTVYAQISMAVGPEKVVEVAHRMGIQSELPAVPSIVLGSGAVSTLEMASAYSTFATNGVLARPHLINKITDRTGEVIYEHRSRTEQVLDPAVAAAARRPLLDVPTSGTGTAARINYPAGGKTGTHQEYRDAWYVGFTPEYSTAVWVGYEADQIPLRNVRINGRTYDRVFGGSVPAPIWAQFMSMVLADVEEPLSFPELGEEQLAPYLKPPMTVVPSLIGLERGAAVDLAQRADLDPRVREIPSLEPPGQVVHQSLRPGATIEAGYPITIYVSNGEVPSGSLPNVRGQPLEEAERIFARFRIDTGVLLTVNITYEDVTDGDQDGVVLSQAPGSGTPVGYLDTVTLVVGRVP